jgi:hypothetical protein
MGKIPHKNQYESDGSKYMYTTTMSALCTDYFVDLYVTFSGFAFLFPPYTGVLWLQESVNVQGRELGKSFDTSARETIELHV